MDSAQHDVLVERIREWFAQREGHEFLVTVHRGSDSVSIAEGPLLGMEEHPVSKGVFRALFTDAHRVSFNPDEEKFVAVGFELADVISEPGRLVLDKGSQRVEIVDRQPRIHPAAEEVSWPTAAGAPAPAHEPVFASVPEPTSAPIFAPAPVPMPAPVATPAPSSPAVPVFQMRVKAPTFGNASASGSGFFGPVDLRIEQGWVTVTGQRSEKTGVMMIMGALLLVLGGISLIFGLVVAINAEGNSDMGFAFCLMGAGLILALVGLALHLVGRKRFMVGPTSSLQFPLTDARGARVHYDDNLGCLLMVFATPIIGLIIMFAMGKRIVRMNVPNDRAPRASRQMLVLKTYTSADGAILNSALRG